MQLSGWRKRSRTHETPPSAPVRRSSFAKLRRVKNVTSLKGDLTCKSRVTEVNVQPYKEMAKTEDATTRTASLPPIGLVHLSAVLVAEQVNAEESSWLSLLKPLALSAYFEEQGSTASVPEHSASPVHLNLAENSTAHAYTKAVDEEENGTVSVPPMLDDDDNEEDQIEESEWQYDEGPLVTCMKCGRVWDGNAQCYPCFTSDEEEEEE